MGTYLKKDEFLPDTYYYTNFDDKSSTWDSIKHPIYAFFGTIIGITLIYLLFN